MLTVLRRPPNGSHLFRFEWRSARGDILVFLRFKRAWSTGRIRAGCRERLAPALARLDGGARAEALAKLDRDLDRAVASGWI